MNDDYHRCYNCGSTGAHEADCPDSVNAEVRRALDAERVKSGAARELLREWYSARKAYRREPAAAGWLGRCEEQLEDLVSKWMPESTGLDEK